MEFAEVIAKQAQCAPLQLQTRLSPRKTSARSSRPRSAPTAGNIQPWRFTVVRSARGPRAACRGASSAVGDRGAGRHRRLRRSASVRRALWRSRRAPLLHSRHCGRCREHPACGGRSRASRHAGSARLTPMQSATLWAFHAPIEPVAILAGGLLGGVGGSSGASPACRSRDLDLEEALRRGRSRLSRSRRAARAHRRLSSLSAWARRERRLSLASAIRTLE